MVAVGGAEGHEVSDREFLACISHYPGLPNRAGGTERQAPICPQGRDQWQVIARVAILRLSAFRSAHFPVGAKVLQRLLGAGRPRISEGFAPTSTTTTARPARNRSLPTTDGKAAARLMNVLNG
ncbi:hypothetical protein GCM10010195_06800 [Kitasatospora griseola]|nr:hypothetical protein GCM10010195_06800 [Kitasatospora griseola]